MFTALIEIVMKVVGIYLAFGFLFWVLATVLDWWEGIHKK